jgi:membrane protease YdiL (CAAX protease family)
MNDAAGLDPFSHTGLSPADEAGVRLRSYVTWGVKELIVGAVVVLLLVFVISVAIVGPVAGHYGDESPETYGASSIASLVWDAAWVATAYLLVRRTGASFVNLGLRRPVYIARDVYDMLRRRAHQATALWLPRLPLAILAGYAAAFLSVEVYGIVVSLLGLGFLEPGEQLPKALFDSDVVVALTGAVIVFAAPVAEEILFRGFLFGGLRRYMPFWAAALASGFIFSLAHGNVGLIIPFTLVGAILAYTYERSGTIFASMGVHFVFNTVSFTLILLFPELR